MSDTYTLPLSLLIALAGPLLALRYLRGIMVQVITTLCPSGGSAEFWWRAINVLALCGSLLLMLIFGPDNTSQELGEVLRRSLLLAALSVFISVAVVTGRIWRGVEHQLAAARPLLSRKTNEG